MSEPKTPTDAQSGKAPETLTTVAVSVTASVTTAFVPGSAPGNPRATEPEPLSRLYHMSTTAGLGSQEYVAINPTAIAALLLGLGSVLATLSDTLLVVPVAGAVCAVVALVQIHRGNGTQTGRAFAAGGLLLALLFGGGRAGHDALLAFRTTADEQQVAQAMQHIGQQIAAGDYQAAYQNFDDRFRERVPFAQFKSTFDSLKENATVGALTSIEWNRQRMQLDEGPDGRTAVYGMALFHYEHRPTDPSRVVMQFAKDNGQWRAIGMPSFFPVKKSRQ